MSKEGAQHAQTTAPARQSEAHRIELAGGTGASGAYGAILRLQQTAGNAAVSRLLQPVGGSAPGVMPGLPAEVQKVLTSGGQPLDAGTRAEMEARFGEDFSQVRMHTDTQAAASARTLQTAAYTAGLDLVFDTGQYAPATNAGQRLLAHELTHVVQQGGVSAAPPLAIGELSCGVEQEAEYVSNHLYSYRDPIPVHYRDTELLIRRNGSSTPPKSAMSDEQLLEVLTRFPKGEEITLYHVDVTGASVKSTESAGRDFPLRTGEFWLTTNVETRTGFKGGAGLNNIIAYRVDSRFLSLIADLALTQRTGAVAEKGLRMLFNVNIAVPRVNFEGGGGGKLPAGDVNIGLRITNEAPELGRLFQLCVRRIEHMRYDPSAPAGSRLVRVKQFYALLPSSRKSDPTTPSSGKPSPSTGGAPLSGKIAASPDAPTRVEIVGRAEAVPETSAHLGAPLEAPHSPADWSAKGAHEGAVQMLHSMLLGSIRGNEAAKAAARLEELRPQIEELREHGYGVTVAMLLEVPKQVDIAAIWASVGDPGQVVYFKRMYLMSVIKAQKSGAEWDQHARMSPNFASGDPEQKDPHEMTLDQQIRAQMGEEYPVKEDRPRDGFKYVTTYLQLGSLAKIEGASQQQGIAGMYSPVAVISVNFGTAEHVRTYGMNRVLQISPGIQFPNPLGAVMWDRNDYQLYETDWSRQGVHSGEFKAHFIKHKRDGSEEYTINSEMRYFSGRGKATDFIVEDVTGEDQDPQWKKGSEWRAVILWRKI